MPDQSFAGWRAVMSANLDGAFLTLQAAMALMVSGRLAPPVYRSDLRLRRYCRR
jgi:NAD(P)-dependent dehydrogenase (short-subunit alcohol dehydrogenase family)